MSPPRYVPDHPLPPYAFSPGKTPHPVSDPAGHQFGRTPEPADVLDVERWHTNRTYLFGIDLFNHGYYWEAHEAWEALWHQCGRKGATADFLKGLIQLAAAGVKHGEGIARGVESHAQRASELFGEVAAALGTESESFLGLQIEELIALAQGIRQDGWSERTMLVLAVLTTRTRPI